MLVSDKKFIILCNDGYYVDCHNVDGHRDFTFTNNKNEARVFLDDTDQNGIREYEWSMYLLEKFNPKLIEL